MRGSRIPFGFAMGSRNSRPFRVLPAHAGTVAVCSTRVTSCHGNWGRSFSIVLHWERRYREDTGTVSCLWNTNASTGRRSPEIQTYLLRTAASPIIMRRGFNPMGPAVNTVHPVSVVARSMLPQWWKLQG